MKIWKMLPPKATLNKSHNGKCDENLLESCSKPKHHHYQISGSNAKAASLSPLPLSVWLALVSDESLSWPYSPGSHVMLSHRSLPWGSHRKSVFPGHLNCPAVQRGEKRKGGQEQDFEFRRTVFCHCHKTMSQSAIFYFSSFNDSC